MFFWHLSRLFLITLVQAVVKTETCYSKMNSTRVFFSCLFQRISISPETDLKYKHYSLNAYSEGVLTKHVREMRFFGTPVLFIPGHSGSGKQGKVDWWDRLQSYCIDDINIRDVSYFIYYYFSSSRQKIFHSPPRHMWDDVKIKYYWYWIINKMWPISV